MLRPRRRRWGAVRPLAPKAATPEADASPPPRGEAPTAGRQPQRNFRTIALIIACALFMEQMDATVLATALPTMARDLRVPVVNVSSALTAYLLALAIFIPASGRQADRYGAKTVFRAAILIFLAGSVLCGQASSLPLLVAARFLQGMGGAMMVPVGRLVLLRSVAKENLVQALSWLIIPALLGPIVGPPLGGFIVTYLNWRWIFYLNIPIGLVGVGLVTRFIDEIREGTPAAFDGIGFVLSGVSLGCLLFGFEMSSRSGELGQALGLLAVGLVAGGLYVRHARSSLAPILDLSLMKIPTFRLSVIAGSLTRITQGAQPFLLPLLFQLGFGMNAAASGTLTIAGALGAFAMKWLAPRALKRFGFRNTLMFNGLLMSAACAVCGFFRPSWPIAAIFLVLTGCGFVSSFQFTALNAIAYDEIPPERMSAATSFYATFQQLMLSIGVCAAASALHLSMLFAGRRSPAFGDFNLAFLAVAAVSAAAIVWNRRFSERAGHELSGRGVAAAAPAKP